MKIARKQVTATIAVKEVRTDLPKFYDLYRDGVTQGLLGTWMWCNTKFKIRVQQGLSPLRTSGALDFGSLVHELLDNVYGDALKLQTPGSEYINGAGDPIDWTSHVSLEATSKRLYERDRKKLVDKDLPQEDEQKMELNYGLANALLRPYLTRFEDDFKGYEFVALEQTFDVPYTFPDGRVCRVRGKFDGIVRINGKLWLLEHKTKSQITETTIVDRLGFNLQVLLYMWAMEQVYGEPVAGVIYNIMRRPGLEQRTKKMPETLKEFLERVEADVNTRPDFYFVRYTASITRTERKAWLKEFDIMMLDFQEWNDRPRYYREEGKCSMGGLTCECLPICANQDLTRFTKREEVFPELVMGGEE